MRASFRFRGASVARSLCRKGFIYSAECSHAQRGGIR